MKTQQWNAEYLPIWPRKHNPVVFCHIAGAEKSLNVATEEGSEQSKSNQAEFEHSVSVKFSDAQIFQKLIYLHLFTECFMKISPQSSEQIQKKMIMDY